MVYATSLERTPNSIPELNETYIHRHICIYIIMFVYSPNPPTSISHPKPKILLHLPSTSFPTPPFLFGTEICWHFPGSSTGPFCCFTGAFCGFMGSQICAFSTPSASSNDTLRCRTTYRGAVVRSGSESTFDVLGDLESMGVVGCREVGSSVFGGDLQIHI